MTALRSGPPARRHRDRAPAIRNLFPGMGCTVMWASVSAGIWVMATNSADVPHICGWISRGLASCSGWSAGCSGEGGFGDFQQLQHLALQRGELGFEGLDEVAVLVVEFVA